MRPAPEDAADDAFDQREYPIPSAWKASAAPGVSNGRACGSCSG